MVSFIFLRTRDGREGTSGNPAFHCPGQYLNTLSDIILDVICRVFRKLFAVCSVWDVSIDKKKQLSETH